MQARAALRVEKPASVEEVWKDFMECLMEEAIEVCRETGESGDTSYYLLTYLQGVLVMERRDCRFGRGEATCIQVVEGALEVQERVQL